MTDSQFQIREIESSDLQDLLSLYKHLHSDDPVLDGDTAETVWQEILADPHHHCFLGCIDGQIVASCVMIIVPNLTRGARPYARIENVVTHADFRKRGYGQEILKHAQSLAWEHNCYKVMLMTGSKQDSTLRFYDNAGFQRGVKTGFIAKPE